MRNQVGAARGAYVRVERYEDSASTATVDWAAGGAEAAVRSVPHAGRTSRAAIITSASELNRRGGAVTSPPPYRRRPA